MDLLETKTHNNRHPWELSRREILFDVVSGESLGIIADIGAGDRFFIEELVKRRGGLAYCCDLNYNEDDLDKSTSSLKIVQNIDDIPDGEIDTVFLLDVLEHIDDDSHFFTKVLTKVKKTGKIVITVPAFQFLFGEHDLFLHHFRRYSRDELQNTISSESVEIEKLHYFYSSLFLLKSMKKIMEKFGIKPAYKNEVSSWKYDENHLLTKTLVKLLNIDFHLNHFLFSQFKISFPGLSLCAVIKKYA